MSGMIRAMKKKNIGIPEDVVSIFEGIIQKNEDELGQPLSSRVKYFEPEWDDEFCQALNQHLSKEQRFRLYETQGGCNGTGADKERKVFAYEHAHLALDERIALFANTFGRRKPVLNDDNTLTLTFKCSHGYYKQPTEGNYTTPPPNVEGYFERCAGGRL